MQEMLTFTMLILMSTSLYGQAAMPKTPDFELKHDANESALPENLLHLPMPIGSSDNNIDSIQTQTPHLIRQNVQMCGQECMKYYDVFYRSKAKEVVDNLELRSSFFRWSYVENKIILVLVILIVINGVVLANKEFSKEKGNKESVVSSLKFSLTGIEATSSGIGFLIFSMSLAFFFLYLKYVYIVMV